MANLTSSRVSMNKMRRLRLFQRDNYLSIDFQTRQGMICRRNVKAGERPAVEVEQFQGGDEEPLKLQLASFVHAIGTSTRPVVSGEDGAAAVGVAYQVLQAIAAFAARHEEGGSRDTEGPRGRRDKKRGNGIKRRRLFPRPRFSPAPSPCPRSHEDSDRNRRSLG